MFPINIETMLGSWHLLLIKKPEIAVAVLVEHGGHGGATAAPIAQKVFKKYFELYPLDPAA